MMKTPRADTQCCARTERTSSRTMTREIRREYESVSDDVGEYAVQSRHAYPTTDWQKDRQVDRQGTDLP